eukprot:5810-Amphidinium_carterae.1
MKGPTRRSRSANLAVFNCFYNIACIPLLVRLGANEVAQFSRGRTRRVISPSPTLGKHRHPKYNGQRFTLTMIDTMKWPYGARLEPRKMLDNPVVGCLLVVEKEGFLRKKGFKR